MNGIRIIDIGLSSDDLDFLVNHFDDVAQNKLTSEDVLKDFNAWRERAKTGLERLKLTEKQFLMLLAIFIYKNGVHSDINEDLILRKASPDESLPAVTWRDMKAVSEFKDKRKTMVVRYVVGIMHKIAEVEDNTGILEIHSEKYELEEYLNEIPKKFRFFGANLHQGITVIAMRSYLDFQKNVIYLSSSKSKKTNDNNK
jgi:hypothetical protein